MNELLELSQRWNLFSAKLSAIIFAVFTIAAFCPHYTDPVATSLKSIGILGLMAIIAYCELVTRFMAATIENNPFNCKFYKIACAVAQIIIHLLLLLGVVMFSVGFKL